MTVLDETTGVAAYATAVRAALGDLTADQVDDLTDGLEVDLADALADERHTAHGRALVEQFGTPQAYAAELRHAAGLAPAARPTATRAHLLGAPVRLARRQGTRLLTRLRTQAWWLPTEAFLVALRPVWWVLRAWIGYTIPVAWVTGGSRQLVSAPRGGLAWLLLGALVVLSVQWGRGDWFQGRRMRRVAVLANAVAVVALLPVLGAAHGELHQRDAVYAGWSNGTLGGPSRVEYLDRPVDGVVVDGMQVSNLFVYDADGNPLHDVQVYDDRGRPVRTTFDNGSEQFWFPEGTEPWTFVGAADTDGRARWNVYPLRGAPASQFQYDDEGTLRLVAGTEPSTPPWPFAKAPAVSAPAGTTTGTLSASGDPSSAPTP